MREHRFESPFEKCDHWQVTVLEREISPRKVKSVDLASSNSEQSLRKLREFPYGDDWIVTRKKHENNDGSACTCGLPNKKYCMLTTVARKDGDRKKKIVWAPMSICSVISSSTPTVPYSTADILYGNEVSGGGTRSQPGDELRQNGFGDLERNKDSRRTKDLENPNNRRPSSKSSKQKSISIDSVTLDKERDDPLKGLSAALPPTKPSHHLRTNGIKSRQGESLFSPKQNGAATGREQDDLVAMGTYWSPNSGGNPQERTSGPVPGPSSSGTLPSQDGGRLRGTGSMANTNTNSYSSKVASSTSVNNTSSSNNTLNTQRKYPSSSMRPIVVQNNVSGKKNTNSREQEDPKYTDPMIGAPASFQQRIIELGALEGDTVRWERSKRLKKKKADRDS